MPFDQLLTHTVRGQIGVSTFTVHRRSDGEDISTDFAVRAVDRAEFEAPLQVLRTWGELPGTDVSFADDFVVSIDGPASLDPDCPGSAVHRV